MRKLRNKTNTIPPTTTYPWGRIKDNPGDNTGSPVNEQSLGDMHQFFEQLMKDGNLTPNDLPENEYSGFQLNTALGNFIAKFVGQEVAARIAAVLAEAVARAAADLAITTQPAWTNITLVNGWAAGTRTPQYRVDTLGKCHFRGDLDPSGASTDTFSTTLPHPSAQVYFYVPIPNASYVGNNPNFTPLGVTTGGAASFGSISLFGGTNKVNIDALSYWT